MDEWCRALWPEPATRGPLAHPFPRDLAFGDPSVAWDGDVYLDGSGFEPQLPSLRKCGWAMVKVNGEGRMLRAAGGALPYPQWGQTVPRSELCALLRLVEGALCGAVINARSDCKAVVLGFAAGPRSEHSGNALAGLWRSVFFASEFKKLNVTVTKVKAHTTEEDVASGLITEVERRANHYVDILAKRAAGLIRLPKEVVDDWVARRKDLIDLLGFLGEVVGYGLGAKLWKSKSDFPTTKRAKEGNLVITIHDHDWALTVGNKWQCCKCRKTAASTAGRDRANSTPCKKWDNRLGLTNGFKGHALYITEDGTVFCGKCGCWAHERIVGLARDCEGVRTCKAGTLRILARGLIRRTVHGWGPR